MNRIRNRFALLLFLPLFALAAGACIGPKQPAGAAQLFPTTLRVEVLDDLGNTQAGAVVTLYKNKEDYEARKNPVAKERTDKKGRAKFKDLEEKVYYMHVEKGDKDNMSGAIKTSKLESGKTNKAKVVISGF